MQLDAVEACTLISKATGSQQTMAGVWIVQSRLSKGVQLQRIAGIVSKRTQGG